MPATLDAHTLDLIDRMVDALHPDHHRAGPLHAAFARLARIIDPAEFAALCDDIERASVDTAQRLTAERFGTPGVLR